MKLTVIRANETIVVDNPESVVIENDKITVLSNQCVCIPIGYADGYCGTGIGNDNLNKIVTQVNFILNPSVDYTDQYPSLWINDQPPYQRDGVYVNGEWLDILGVFFCTDGERTRDMEVDIQESGLYHIMINVQLGNPVKIFEDQGVGLVDETGNYEVLQGSTFLIYHKILNYMPESFTIHLNFGE